MNKHSRIVLVSSVMTLGLVSAFSVGLSSWLLVNNVAGGSTTITGADVDDATISGMSWSYRSDKLGRYYFFGDDNSNSDTGTLKYTIDITYKDLPAYLKKESLYMVGNLSLWNNGTKIVNFFDPYFTYMKNTNPWSSATSTENSISITSESGSSDTLVYEPSESLLTLPSYGFNLNPNEDTQLVLEFRLTQQCLLNTTVREILLNDNTKFHLFLRVGVNDTSTAEGGE